VSGQQVEEYEKTCQKFWTALKSRMTKVGKSLSRPLAW
jgi:hypothetical protein